MARKAGRRIGKLTDRQVKTAKGPAFLGDGGGLYLKVDGGSKSWVFLWSRGGKARRMGLGPTHALGLADARKRAETIRNQLLDGIDPMEARRAAAVAAAKSISFDAATTRYIESHKAGWKNAKHVQQWEATLATYASPVFGKLPVSVVDTDLVMRVLGPIWTTKNATAFRVRGRIEAILAWATVHGFRSGVNAATWRNNLDKLLPAPTKVRKTVHHPAMAYAELPAFMDELRARQDIASRALEFLIACAARSGEVLGAKWDEFDLDARLWTVPAERMKRHREHRVPLSDCAIAIIEEMQAIKRSEFVFPGTLRGKGLGSQTFLVLLRTMGHDGVTVHGFRSSFRDWAAECTNFQREVIEQSLAHVVGDATDWRICAAIYWINDGD
ncbi:MAG: integrase arm-type DNA-binding domain-containing protein [Hyphomicrobiaceae bacterium]